MTYSELLQIFDALRLNWPDLVIPLAVFGLVYAAHAAGLANTPDRKRIAGALAALALSSLRTVTLGVFRVSELGAVVEIALVAAGAWVLSALAYEGKGILEAGLAAKSG
ncbi:MAG: hypothetical protein KIT08_01240 [Anaerolineales bacterium]|nr:MAG: hypothetical protein KIT08_01240 [Anaerolineales bacterium]